MTDTPIDELARELTEEQWARHFRAEAIRKATPGMVPTKQDAALLAYMRELAAGLGRFAVAELRQMGDCTDDSPAECDRRGTAALERRGLCLMTSLRGPGYWVMFYPTPLGRAVLRVLEAG